MYVNERFLICRSGEKNDVIHYLFSGWMADHLGIPDAAGYCFFDSQLPSKLNFLLMFYSTFEMEQSYSKYYYLCSTMNMHGA